MVSIGNGAVRRPVVPVGLSYLLAFLQLTIGLVFLIRPDLLLFWSLASTSGRVESAMDDPEQQPQHLLLSPLGTLLAQMAGALLLSLSSCSFALLSSSSKYVVPDVYVSNTRVSLFCQGQAGLLVLLLALYGERQRTTKNGSNDDQQIEQTVKSLLLGGSVFVVVSCIGLMLSFWPKLRETNVDIDTTESGSVSGHHTSSESQSRSRARPGRAGSNQDLLQPLLDDADGANGTNNTTCNHGGENDNQEDDDDPTRSSQDEDDPDTNNSAAGAPPPSRIQGTKRLLKLAAPQVSYLYMGCAVLLVRLPFSLSIPHFVSTTLGALGREDYATARTEILLLFVLGTIDAALDFWCVFLFGYAKERIVRGVRIDTFVAILRQEIAFFDQNTSGELSSRITSDCGAMAGGKE